jgi:citrate lyase subunit beta/citryl-CoA lyase
VGVVQAAYTPSTEAIARAMAIITAFRMHEQAGVGAFTYHNQMIDAPTIKQCENVVQLAYAANLIDHPIDEGEARDPKP